MGFIIRTGSSEECGVLDQWTHYQDKDLLAARGRGRTNKYEELLRSDSAYSRLGGSNESYLSFVDEESADRIKMFKTSP